MGVMSPGNDSQDEQTPIILDELWDNWRQGSGGGGRCSGCDAHWSERPDFPDEPGDRNNAFGHRPLYGEGSLDPDIVVMAREPGEPEEFNRDDNHLDMSFDDARHRDITKTPGKTIENAMPLLKRLKESEYPSYFTQIRKCNKIKSQCKESGGVSDTEARRQCAGTKGYEGYLFEEIQALDPNHVITTTTEGQTEFCEVFELPEVNTRAMASGTPESGMITFEQEQLDFTWFPAPHPDSRGTRQVFDHLETVHDTSEYWTQFADDVLSYIRDENQGA